MENCSLPVIIEDKDADQASASSVFSEPSSVSSMDSGRLSVSSQIVSTHKVEQSQVSRALTHPKKRTHQRSLSAIDPIQKPFRPNSPPKSTTRRRRTLSANDKENLELNPEWYQGNNQKQKSKSNKALHPRKGHRRSNSAYTPVMVMQPISCVATTKPPMLRRRSFSLCEAAKINHYSDDIKPIISTETASCASECSEFVAPNVAKISLESEDKDMKMCVCVSSQWLKEIDKGSLVVGKMMKWT